MNNLIVHLIFGILTIISLIGIGIIISNSVKIKNFNTALKKKLYEMNRREIAYVRTEPIYKLISVLPKIEIISKPILLLPAPMHQMKMLN